MSEPDAGRLAERLREIAAKLREPDLSEDEAEALAREAADLVSRASHEIDAAIRDLPGEER